MLGQVDLRLHIVDAHNCSDIDFFYHGKPRSTCNNSLQKCHKQTPYLGTCTTVFLITTHKRSLQEGNIFGCVCLVCLEGGTLDLFKLVYLGIPQTYWQAGGWPLTIRSSCFVVPSLLNKHELSSNDKNMLDTMQMKYNPI